MAHSHLDIVRTRLKEYADKGVFDSFSEGNTRGRRTEFRLGWFHFKHYTLIFDEGAGTLRLRDFLPHLDAKSQVYATLKDFVANRSDRKLVAHRRIDPRRAEAKLSLRNRSGTLTMTVKNNQYTYAVRKTINLVHEIFVMLNADHIEYLYENFDLPEE